MSAENGRHNHGDRPSDTNMSFNMDNIVSMVSSTISPLSARSPVVAVADPS